MAPELGVAFLHGDYVVAAFVAGCVGEHSTVRRLVGFRRVRLGGCSAPTSPVSMC